MEKYNRAILFANGEIAKDTALEINQNDYLIAVDGGLRHLSQLNLSPNLLIGDLDSVNSSELQKAEAAGVEIMRYPVEKDESDLELAALEALRRGFSEILITGTSGGRIDHILACLAILAMPDLQKVNAKIADGKGTVYYIKEDFELDTEAGDLISLQAWGEGVHGLSTTGLKWELSNASLHPWGALGLSNIALQNRITVSLKSGQLYLTHTKNQSNHKKEHDA